MGRHSLLQGILLTQRSNPGLLHCRWILYPLSHQGSPNVHSSIVYLFIKVPSTDEWINVCLTHTHTHTLTYYSAVIKNESLPFETTYLDGPGGYGNMK